MKIIKVDYGAVAQIAAICRCGRATVFRALRGITDSPQSREIRAIALTEEYGGRYIDLEETKPYSNGVGR